MSIYVDVIMLDVKYIIINKMAHKVFVTQRNWSTSLTQ